VLADGPRPTGVPCLRRPVASTRRHARFSVAEFHRLCELLPERRLELIDGEVLEVIAKGTWHTAVMPLCRWWM
jgi:Uma2 family endonuclease